MSNRLDYIQQKRMRTYEMLRGQPTAAIRAALNVKPGHCPYAALERLRIPFERDPDPRPNLNGEATEVPKVKRHNPRLLELLARHYESGEPVPTVPGMAEATGLSKSRLQTLTRDLQVHGHLAFRVVGTRESMRRYVVRWSPPS